MKSHHHTSQWTMCFLRCKKCQICTYDFEFGINKLYLRHIRPHYHSHTAARSLLMFVPHGSVGVMAFFVPPSLVGQCYSKLLMWSGCFDVVHFLITPHITARWNMQTFGYCSVGYIVLKITISLNVWLGMLFVFIISYLDNEPLSVWFSDGNMVVILIIHRRGQCKAAVSSLGTFLFYM